MTLLCVECLDYFEVPKGKVDVKFGYCPKCQKKDRKETPRILASDFNPTWMREESEGQDPFWMEIKQGFRATATFSQLEFDEIESGDDDVPNMSSKAIRDLIASTLNSMQSFEKEVRANLSTRPSGRSRRIYNLVNRPRMV